MKQPNPKTLHEIADRWNADHRVGTPVIHYKLIDPLKQGQETKTDSVAWVMGGHSVMVMLIGISGGVPLGSVFPLTNDDMMRRPEDENKLLRETLARFRGQFDSYGCSGTAEGVLDSIENETEKTTETPKREDDCSSPSCSQNPNK